MLKRRFKGLVLALMALTFFVGCATSTPSPTPSGAARLRVVATTTLVGDVVRQVGADFIDLQVLLPPGADPHSFEPAPQDAAKLANADLVFASGLDLEAFL